MLHPRLAATRLPIMLIVLAFGVGACSSGGGVVTGTPVEQGGGTRVPTLSGDGRFVVAPFTQQLVAYDLATHWPTQASSEQNFFYYGFRDMSGLYTSGNSTTGGFSVVRML